MGKTMYPPLKNLLTLMFLVLLTSNGPAVGAEYNADSRPKVSKEVEALEATINRKRLDKADLDES